METKNEDNAALQCEDQRQPFHESALTYPDAGAFGSAAGAIAGVSRVHIVHALGEEVLVKIEDELDNDLVQPFPSSENPTEDPLTGKSYKFVCPHCGSFKTDSVWGFESHLAKHAREKPEVCGLCGLELPNRKSLNFHVRCDHAGEKLYSCNLCGLKAATTSYLKHHMLKHGKPPFSCGGSSEESSEDHLAEQPRYVCQKDKLAACSLCDAKFSSKHSLDYHSKTDHSGETPFACNKCNFKTATSKSLSRHLLFKHTRKIPFMCNLCEFTSIARSIVRKHMEMKHTDVKPFECKMCDFRTKRKDALVTHVRTHTGETPFCCNHCGRRFKASSGLRGHMKTAHIDKRSFACKLCDFQTKLERSLKSHMTAAHSEDKPFQCALCDFRTKSKVGIRRHMKAHADGKPGSFVRPLRVQRCF